MRAFVSRLVVAGLSIVVGLAVLELGMRLAQSHVAPEAERSTAVDDLPQPSWRKPDFRGRPHHPFKRRLGFRVLVLGDSFTWGSGVHAADAYPARLGRALTRLPLREKSEVLAWSRPGWNTVNALRSLEGAKPKVRFDLMVVGFVLNDAEPSNAQHTEELRQRHGLGATHRRRPESATSRALDRHSALFRFAWERLENTRQRRVLTRYYRSLYEETEDWQHCREALQGLAAIARHAEAPAIFLLFPIFDSPLDDRYPYSELHDKAADAARDAGFEVIDLLPSFAGIDARRLAVQPWIDPHPNELAHRITADVLVDYLMSRDLLPLVEPASQLDPPETEP